SSTFPTLSIIPYARLNVWHEANFSKRQSMSALRGKADIGACPQNVRSRLKSDIAASVLELGYSCQGCRLSLATILPQAPVAERPHVLPPEWQKEHANGLRHLITPHRPNYSCRSASPALVTRSVTVASPQRQFVSPSRSFPLCAPIFNNF